MRGREESVQGGVIRVYGIRLIFLAAVDCV